MENINNEIKAIEEVQEAGSLKLDVMALFDSGIDTSVPRVDLSQKGFRCESLTAIHPITAFCFQTYIKGRYNVFAHMRNTYYILLFPHNNR